MMNKPCILCGSIAISIDESEYNGRSPNFFRYINTKYCTKCADAMYLENHRRRSQAYRQNRKRVQRAKDQRLRTLTEYAQLLCEENSELQKEVDYLRNRLTNAE